MKPYHLLAFPVLLALMCADFQRVVGQRRRDPRSCPDGCLCFITTVRCMHLGLDHIPSVPSETRILDLRFNRIRNIPSSTFRGMRNLNTLLLNNNQIRTISEDAFHGLTSLKYLYLYKNKIQTIHKRAFKGLVSLEQLYLHDNEIRSLAPATFSNLPKLERLFLHSNMLKTLPNRLFSKLISLKRLRLDSNHLQCDCRLAWLARLLSNLRNRIQAAATCDGPRRLAGRSLASVSIPDMTCDTDDDTAEPIFTVHPTNTDFQQGQPVRLLCRARGSPQPDISWQHDGRPVNDDGRVRVMSDGTLFIQSPLQSDRGLYRCIAENRLGEVESNEARLDYKGADGIPLILVAPSNEEVVVGEHITFHCQASGNPTPVTRWYRNKERLQPDTNYIIMKGSLHIRTATDRDNGTFTCVAANSEGSVNRSASLLVKKPPVFTVTPNDQTAAQGESVTFDCQAEGVPTPTISWLRNGEPLNRNRDQRYLVMSSGSLLIRAINPDDEGTYTCKARSVSGASIADSSLTVILRPHFLIRPQNKRVPQGNTVDFQCQVAGRPQPHIVWTVNGRAVPDDSRYNLLPSGTLRLLRVKPSDAGRFRCDAANAYGEQHAEVTLTVIDQVPLTFTRTPVDQFVESGSNVRLVCQIRGGLEDRQAEIFWRKDGVRIVPSNERYSLTPAPSSVLTISGVGRDDSGRYECTARSGTEVISSSMALIVRVRSSIGDIVEKLSEILPPNCLRHGCSRELIDEEDLDEDTGGEESYRQHLSGKRKKRQSGLPNLVSFSELEDTVRTASFEVDRGINGSISYFNNGRSRPTSGDLLALMRFPSTREEIDTSRAAEVFDVSLRMIECCVRRGMRLKKFRLRPQPSAAEEFDSAADVEAVQTRSSDGGVDRFIDGEIVELVANLSGCASHRPVPDCSKNICFHRKYRSTDGTCNNLQHPMWGASRTPFHRLLQPIYENGFNAPVGWNPQKRYNNHLLPSARIVSVSALMSAGSKPPQKDPVFTHMVMQWGQFLDHDLDFTTMAPSIQRFSDGLACRESCERGAPCFPITVDSTDSRHGRFHHHNPSSRSRNRSSGPRNSESCMEFTRSSAVCGSGITSVFFSAISRREQINEITSYLDASNVYSSSDKDTNNLRDLSNDGGLLKEGQSLEIGQLPLLPYNVFSDLDSSTPLIGKIANIECRRGDRESAQQQGVPCFLAGDLRANEQVGLTAMHTLWMREHNRIARYLKKVNTHWDGDTIFHETRKIIGAQMQHITYKHWLPKLLGTFSDRIGSYSEYDPNTPSSIVNVFATAAYRFGHTMINPILYRLNETWHEDSQGHLMLHEAFFAPFRIVHEGGIDPLIRGLIAKAMKARDSGSSMNQELIERLFSMAEEVALDLGALNIQRGRDHALPFYNDWRQYCNLSRADTFDDLAEEIKNPQVREKLRELYKVPSNIDAFVGMILEDVVPESRLGPTLGCILTEQFKRTRDGDRFWYENPGVFTPAQLTAIRQSSLARVICDNTDSIGTLPRDVFLIQSTSDFVSCDSVSSVDLSAWIECCSDCESSGSFETLSGHVVEEARRKRSLDMSQEAARFEISLPDDQSFSRSTQKETDPVNQISSEVLSLSEKSHQNERTQESLDRMIQIIKSLENRVSKLQDELDKLKSQKPNQDIRNP